MSSYQHISTELIEFYRKPFASISLELILTLGLILILITAVIRPTLTTMSELSRELEEKEELLIKLEKKSTALTTAQSVYMSALPKLTLLDQAMPSQSDLITDLKTIEKMVSDNTMIINSLALSQLPANETKSKTADTDPKTEEEATNTEQSELVVTAPIALSTGGDYLSIRNFVNDLITYRRLFVINSITFSIDKKREMQALSAQLTLEAPYELE